MTRLCLFIHLLWESGYLDMEIIFKIFSSVQFSSISQLCLTLCDPMDCSTPGLPLHHQLLELVASCPLSHWCHPTNSSSVVSFSSCLQSFPASGSFPMIQFFASCGQSTGASASVLPINMQDLFPLGLTGLISLQSKGLLGVFSSTTVWFGTSLLLHVRF